MNLRHREFNSQYLAAIGATGEPTNDAKDYGVRVVQSDVPEGETYWRVIGIHHLTPDENRGNHHIYLEILDEEGKRIETPRAWAGWTWQDRRPEEVALPVPFDKPASEPASDIPLGGHQKASVWICGFAPDASDPSDRVENLYTGHADEPAPGGELWNSWGHHSYYVVFQRTRRVALEPAIGVISGRVANGRGYRVRLFRGDITVAEQTVDDHFAFRFDNLRAGVYRLEATGPAITRDAIRLDVGRSQVTVDLTAS